MIDESAVPTRRFSAPPRATVLIAMIIVLADQISKHWAVSNLSAAPARHVVWTLQWNLTYNRGMAFSSGTGLGPVIGLIAIGIVVVLLACVGKVPGRLPRVAAGFVVGGALGNVVDRLFRGDGWLRGAVVDFVDFQWFPIFNIADVAVNVGGGLFLLWSFVGQQPSARVRPS